MTLCQTQAQREAESIYPPLVNHQAAEITALRKRVEELEGALEPFVPAHQYWMNEYPDGARCALYNRVTWGDVRRAHAALRAKGGEHGG